MLDDASKQADTVAAAMAPSRAAVAGPASSDELQTPPPQKRQRTQKATPTMQDASPDQQVDELTDGELKTRAKRGTANTFAGRRAPKDPAKLQIFMAKKAAYEKAKQEAKEASSKGLTPPKHTENQQAYWKHMSESTKANGGRSGFADAVGKWSARKRPAAATSSTAGADSGVPSSVTAGADSGVPSNTAAASVAVENKVEVGLGSKVKGSRKVKGLILD